MSNPVFSRKGGGIPSYPAAQQGGYATWNAPGAGVGQQQPGAQVGGPGGYAPPKYMTMDDVVVRTAAMIGIILVAGAINWMLVPDEARMPVTIIGLIGGLVLGLVNSFKRTPSAPLILAYAALEGLFLGGISSFFEAQWSGIVIQAILGTLFVFAGMLVVYRTGAIRVTPKFQRWMMGALIGVAGLMLVNLLAAVIGGGDGLGLRSGGTLAIVFSLVCIGIAAFAFLLDFDMVDKAISRGAPQNFAWYAAFGLTVTLVWLYLEILRLLSYFRE